MSTLSQFAGKAATRVIVNGHSSGSTASGATAVAGGQFKTVASGALTANTLATALTVTGAGWCSAIHALTADTTSRTVRLQVIVDGVTAFDATSSAITTAASGLIAVGSPVTNSGGSVQLQEGAPIRFNASLVIKIASSLSETDKINVGYRYITE